MCALISFDKFRRLPHPNRPKMTNEPRPRYRWRLTWPDERQDHFIVFDGKRKFGIIHAYHTGSWFWSMYWDFPFENHLILNPMGGYAATARLAAKEVEDCYDAVRAGTWPGMTDLDRQRLAEGRVGEQEEILRRRGEW